MSAALASLPFLWHGLLITLTVSASVVVISLGTGLLGGFILIYGPAPLRWLMRGYVDVIRGIPVLVLIFFVYYGLPALGFQIGSLAAGIVALSLFKTAHVAEIVRGTLQSIPAGQTDAGKAIGLTFGQRFVYIILPQAVRRFLPPWINSVTEAVKGSALVSLVGVVDLMLAIQQVIGRTYEPLPIYLLGALIYFAINYSLSQSSRRLEARFAHARE